MKFKHLFSAAAITLALSFGFTSCSSDDDDHFDPNATISTKDLSSSSQTKNSKGIVVEKASGIFELRNFQQFELDENGQIIIEDIEIKEGDKVVRTEKKEKTSAVYYFDFTNNDAATKEKHSISFDATRMVSAKTNTDRGYTLSAIDKKFEDVVATDEFLAAANNSLGLALPAPTAPGWALYSGAPAHRVDVKENYTMILSKDGKPVVKFRINSIYENGKPNKDEQPDNMVFYSIDYQAL